MAQNPVFLYVAAYSTEGMRTPTTRPSRICTRPAWSEPMTPRSSPRRDGKVHVHKHEKPTQHGAWTGSRSARSSASCFRRRSSPPASSAPALAVSSDTCGEACRARTSRSWGAARRRRGGARDRRHLEIEEKVERRSRTRRASSRRNSTPRARSSSATQATPSSRRRPHDAASPPWTAHGRHVDPHPHWVTTAHPPGRSVLRAGGQAADRPVARGIASEDRCA